jgi:hypothetical protein
VLSRWKAGFEHASRWRRTKSARTTKPDNRRNDQDTLDPVAHIAL